jgi:hypothetical protein
MPCPSHHMRTGAIYELGDGLSPETKSVSTLILGIPTPKAVRNKFLLFVSY